MTRAAKMKALKKRAEHLRERTKANPTLTFDRAELAALDWAIEELHRLQELEK